MKVVLSADGGDELFGGYTHYQRAIRLYNKLKAINSGIRHSISKSTRALMPPKLRKKIFPLNFEHKLYAFEEIITSESPVQFFESFIANQSLDEIENLVNHATSISMRSIGSSQDGLQDMMAWDFQYYLPDDLLVKVDRATMFHSVECREPFLDHRLVEFAMRLPPDLKIKNSKGKYLLRLLLKRYVPEEYYERKKQGFSIPLYKWFSRELDQLFDQYMTIEKLSQIPFLDKIEIQNEFRKYLYYKKRHKQYNIEKMWRILSFMLWWDSYAMKG
jgi:asparagine synthase (glutamine-hydrolysing)